METEQKAKEIYQYLKGYLFSNLKIEEKQEQEYIQEIVFIIDNS